MSQDSIVLGKSLQFAARIVKLYQYLTKKKHETVISKQIIRSGTSIGANAHEAVYGVSKGGLYCKNADFPERNCRNRVLAETFGVIGLPF
jgi:hypothetical protein